MEASQVIKKYKKFHMRDVVTKIILCLPILIFALACVIPFWAMIMASLSENDLLEELGIGFLPRGFSVAAYTYVFMFPGRILNSYLITILVTVVGTVISLFMSLLTAYALSKQDFRYGKIIGFYLFFTILFNGGLIPTFILLKRYLQLYDNIWVLILPSLSMPTNIFLLKVFFQSLENALFESAKLDGANEFVAFSKIGVPLVLPGMITVMFFIVLAYWNDAQTPLIYIESQNLEPLQLMLQRINDYIKFIQNNAQMGGGMAGGMEVPEETMIYATSIVAMGPILIVFAFFQKYFVKGLTAGAVKG